VYGHKEEENRYGVTCECLDSREEVIKEWIWLLVKLCERFVRLNLKVRGMRTSTAHS